ACGRKTRSGFLGATLPLSARGADAGAAGAGAASTGAASAGAASTGAASAGRGFARCARGGRTLARRRLGLGRTLLLTLLREPDDRQTDAGTHVDAHVARRRQRHRELALAAVDHDQVGQLPRGVVVPTVGLLRAPEPPRQHLVHRREV